MNFNQKFEPKGNKIIHGAGQSLETFTNYWNAVEKYKPKIYMTYIRINKIKEWSRNIEEELNNFPNLMLQIGFNLKPKGEKEKTKEIVNKKYDNEIFKLIKFAKKFKKGIFLRTGYEFNNPNHNYNPKDFIFAWRYIVNLFRKNNVKNVAFVWNCCTAFTRDIKKIMEYYPGDSYVDWFSDNLFGVKHFTNKNNPKIIAEDFLKEAEKHKKPVMIGESSPAGIGVEKGEESWNNWFKPYFKWIEDHPIIKAFCYINWNWGKDWKQPEWLNGRIEENEIVRENYLKELSKSKYLHYTK